MSGRLDRSALVWGALFIVIGLGALLDELGVVALEPSFVVPALLVVAGLVLTVTAFAGRGTSGRATSGGATSGQGERSGAPGTSGQPQGER